MSNSYVKSILILILLLGFQAGYSQEIHIDSTGRTIYQPPPKPLPRTDDTLAEQGMENNVAICSPGKIVNDVLDDIDASWADIREVGGSLNGEELTVTMELKDIPGAMEFNREGVNGCETSCETNGVSCICGRTEYSWNVFIDTDNDKSTGYTCSNSPWNGSDYQISLAHLVWPDNVGQTVSLPLEQGVNSLNVLEPSCGDCCMSVTSVAVFVVDDSANTLSLEGHIPGISSNSKILPFAYDGLAQPLHDYVDACLPPISAPPAPRLELCMALDGSGSISADDFQTEVKGFANALRSAVTVPPDGSVTLSVVQFGDEVLLEIPPTQISNSQVANSIADTIASLQQVGGGTPIGETIDLCVDQFTFNSAKQVIDVVTDGEDTTGYASQAADAAIAAGVEAVNGIGIGANADVTAFVRPNFDGIDPPEDGFALTINNFAEYNAAIRNKLAFEVGTGFTVTSSDDGHVRPVHGLGVNPPSGALVANNAQISGGPLTQAVSLINNGPPDFSDGVQWVPIITGYHRQGDNNGVASFRCQDYSLEVRRKQLPYVSTSYPLTDIDQVTYDNCHSAWYRFTLNLPDDFIPTRLEGVANVDDQGVVFLNGTPISGLMTAPCEPQAFDVTDPCWQQQDALNERIGGNGLPIMRWNKNNVFSTDDTSLILPGENEIIFGIVGEASPYDPTGLEFTATVHLERDFSDFTPDLFHFDPQTNVPLNAWIESNTIMVTGIDAASPIVIQGGEYAVGNGSFMAEPGSVASGQTVKVRVLSADQPDTASSTKLTIGGVSATFVVTTLAGDTVPNPFAFPAVTGVPQNVWVESNTITVTGITAPAPIRVLGGEYAIDNDAFTAEDGQVLNGQQVKVRVMSADRTGSTTAVTLVIGSEEHNEQATFRVTTQDAVIDRRYLPFLRGLTIQQADAILASHGHSMGNVTTVPSPVVPPGKIMDQYPPFGVPPALGDDDEWNPTDVDIVISGGPECTSPGVHATHTATTYYDPWIGELASNLNPYVGAAATAMEAIIFDCPINVGPKTKFAKVSFSMTSPGTLKLSVGGIYTKLRIDGAPQFGGIPSPWSLFNGNILQWPRPQVALGVGPCPIDTRQTTISSLSGEASTIAHAAGGEGRQEVIEATATACDTVQVISPVATTMEVPIHISGSVVVGGGINSHPVTRALGRLSIKGSFAGQSVDFDTGDVVHGYADGMPTLQSIDETVIISVPVIAGTTTLEYFLESYVLTDSKAFSLGGFSSILVNSATSGIQFPNTIEVGNFRGANDQPLPEGMVIRSTLADLLYTIPSCGDANSTDLQLTSSANPTPVGESVTFTATVQYGANPTGTVAFTADGNPIAGCNAVSVNGGQAQCTTASLSAGNHSIQANYSGDGCHTASNANLTQTVSATQHTLTITKTGNGTITSTPAGIDCGSTCVADFANHTSVTLAASPSAGWTFEGWGGVCIGTGTCVLTMDTDHFIEAIFAATEVMAERIGVKRGSQWYFDRNGNGAWNAGDGSATFGLASDQPVVGDWNGDGKTEIGVKRGTKWYLDYNGSGTWNSGDRAYTFGLASDQPVAGDWNGDGKTEIGVKRGTKWYLDYNGSGTWNSGDRAYTFGLASDQLVVGDWNGDGKTSIGVKRGTQWYLDYNGSGTWNSGDRVYTFGLASDQAVVGDWNGDGKTSIGVKRGTQWYLDYNGSGTWNSGDQAHTFGLASDKPVAGQW